MKSIIDTLPAETIQTLLAWCDSVSYREVSARAAKSISEGGLNLKISPSTLCRLYTSHGIAESKQARAEYTQALEIPPGSTLMDAARDQLELRIFELSSRPNPSLAELRLLFQITSRLRSLQLSERRVVVSEKREARAQTKADQPSRKTNVVPPGVLAHRVRVLLGKEAPDERDIEIEEIERAEKRHRHR